MTPAQGDKTLAVDVASLQWQRDQLTSAIATKQAILNDLETRTNALSKLKEQTLKDASAAQDRLQSLQDELSHFLAAIPTLSTDLAEVVRNTVDAAVGERIDRVVRQGLKKQLLPALRAALAAPVEKKP